MGLCVALLRYVSYREVKIYSPARRRDSNVSINGKDK